MNVIQAVSLVVAIGGGVVSLILGVIMHKRLTVIIGAIFLMLAGAIDVIGWLADAPQLYTMPTNGIGMALTTGICFFVCGGCVLILSIETEFKTKAKS